MSSTQRGGTAPGQRIPVPAEFPVTWEHPDDVKLAWQLDPHSSEPLAPLSCSVSAAVLRGFNPAFAQLGLPLQLRLAFFNGFPYAAGIPTSAPPELVMKTVGALNRVAPAVVKLLMGRTAAGMEKQQLDRLNPLLARLDTYWQDDLLPEIKQHFAYFESCDLRGLSLAQLRAHLTESLKRAQRLGELHVLATIPAMFAVSLFDELYCELFEGATSLDALRLLQGFDNKTLEGDRVLWQLSREALTMPMVSHVLTELEAAEVIPVLEQSSEGRRFLSDLHAYLNRYGQRFNVFGGMSEPSWIEDPTPAIACLQSYVARPDTPPEAEQAHLAAECEQAVAEARATLAGYPQPVVARFETLMKAAQSGASIKEDSHWAFVPIFYQMRRLGLEFGRRLAAAGMLGTADDVFYVTSDELLDGRNEDARPPQERMQERVQERKAALERFRRMTPPPMLGSMPAFEPPDGGALFRAMMKTEMGSTGDSGDAQTLRGVAGSPGVARGTAKVIRSLAEAGKLQPGDVLVAQMTLPPWTPLFGIAAAVVTDIGGVLSHCAIVAREYRIPAVVGAGTATRILHDGQAVEVDGSAGLVRLLPTLGETEDHVS
jgi:phosphohistidine swiveling domain-containing protein